MSNNLKKRFQFLRQLISPNSTRFFFVQCSKHSRHRKKDYLLTLLAPKIVHFVLHHLLFFVLRRKKSSPSSYILLSSIASYLFHLDNKMSSSNFNSFQINVPITVFKTFWLVLLLIYFCLQ